MNLSVHAFVIRLAFPAAVLLVTGVLLSRTAAQKPSAANHNELVSRGAYIVNGVARCSECHTPRTGSGGLDNARWLEGAPLWVEPAMPTANWPLNAPRIAGTLPASDSDLISLLTTGTWRGGERLRPPMPQFRMTRDDAAAVVAYLRSLNAGVK